MQLNLCCHTELMLHHYDCNHEMNQFEDELHRPLTPFFFSPPFILLRQPRCGQVKENMFSKHHKS